MKVGILSPKDFDVEASTIPHANRENKEEICRTPERASIQHKHGKLDYHCIHW